MEVSRVLGVSLHILPQTKGGKNMKPLEPGDICLRSVGGEVFSDFATGT